MAILSINGKWVHLKDLSLTAAPWPRGGKDVISLFYHIENTGTSKAIAAAKDTGRRKASHSSIAPPGSLC